MEEGFVVGAAVGVDEGVADRAADVTDEGVSVLFCAYNDIIFSK